MIPKKITTGQVALAIGEAFKPRRLTTSKRWLYQWEAWRARAVRFADVLKERIEALDGKSYPGCGFYYDQLPYLNATVDQLTLSWSNQFSEAWKPIIARVRLEWQAARVAKAERFILEHSA